MTSLQASRTLVKSPPELWAELSELESLARHLGEFGEIRLTKVDPESRVEWEADRASGTVRLEPSGWGTRVVLTVDTPEPAELEAAEPEAAPPEPTEAVFVAGSPDPASVAATPPQPEGRPEPAPEPEATAPEPTPVKHGWFARLFRRKPAPLPPPPAPEPVAAAPEPEPHSEPEPEPEPEPEQTERDRAFGTIEWETPVEPVVEEPEPEPLQADEAHAVLTSVLDTLGAAHHRPFSRS
jgi:hypothetical protein